ncbi:MAG: peptidylprolyl isomerase [Victivallales bacterium]|nr:peptidylprolyl isomerase [Victivallales bacterium]
MKLRICFAMMACVLLAVCADEPAVAPNAEPAVSEAPKEPNPVVRITTSVGDMLVELYEDECPNTVANFIELAEKEFYVGMNFHRVIPGFMAQGGCPNSKYENNEMGSPGTGGPGYRFDDEFSPKLKHTERGILSMANSGPKTNGSQFFITFAPTSWLDGHHTVFGKVIEGLEVLDKIEAVGTPEGNPKKTIVFNVEVVSKRDHEYHVKKLGKKQPSEE